MIQLREKEMPNRELLPLARDLRELTAATGTLLIINDRVEIAALCGADGVHQGQDDLPPEEARKILGSTAIVGVSTHAPEQASEAERRGADYIGVGPIFETRTVEHRQAVGIEYIQAAERAAPAIPARPESQSGHHLSAHRRPGRHRRAGCCLPFVPRPGC